MRRGAFLRGVVAALAIWIALGVLRFKPWRQTNTYSKDRTTIQVGFLPVT
jgi:hypothetical protein